MPEIKAINTHMTKKTEQTIKSLVTRDYLLDRAGDKFFARGEDYYARDFVEMVFHAPDCVIAKVWGTHPYLVEFGIDENGLSYECTCPAFEDWHICKHIVATGLALIDADKPAHKKGTRLPPKEKPSPDEHFPNIADWVLDGWIEIGPNDYSNSYIRAGDEGGMIWEGKRKYPSFEQALEDAEQAIKKWVNENCN